jgi:hypothetical protein
MRCSAVSSIGNMYLIAALHRTKETVYIVNCLILNVFLYIFGGLECVGHSFAYVAHSVCFNNV